MGASFSGIVVSWLSLSFGRLPSLTFEQAATAAHHWQSKVFV
jgi:hypothetical protein